VEISRQAEYFQQMLNACEHGLIYRRVIMTGIKDVK
jgi:hypothetical protein